MASLPKWVKWVVPPSILVVSTILVLHNCGQDGDLRKVNSSVKSLDGHLTRLDIRVEDLEKANSKISDADDLIPPVEKKPAVMPDAGGPNLPVKPADQSTLPATVEKEPACQPCVCNPPQVDCDCPNPCPSMDKVEADLAGLKTTVSEIKESVTQLASVVTKNNDEHAITEVLELPECSELPFEIVQEYRTMERGEFKCWDTNKNGACDLKTEDRNHKDRCTIEDCCFEKKLKIKDGGTGVRVGVPCPARGGYSRYCVGPTGDIKSVKNGMCPQEYQCVRKPIDIPDPDVVPPPEGSNPKLGIPCPQVVGRETYCKDPGGLKYTPVQGRCPPGDQWVCFHVRKVKKSGGGGSGCDSGCCFGGCSDEEE